MLKRYLIKYASYAVRRTYNWNRNETDSSDSGRFSRIALSVSKCVPWNLSLNYEFIGFCPMQIG